MSEAHAPKRGILAVPIVLPPPAEVEGPRGDDLFAEILRSAQRPVDPGAPSPWTCGYDPPAWTGERPEILIVDDPIREHVARQNARHDPLWRRLWARRPWR